jgi:hypothetical protein
MAVVAIAAVLMLAAFAKMAMQNVAKNTAKAVAGGSILAKIDLALVGFVQQNRRLPCPADGTIATGVANAGVEAAVCNPASETTGVVPWVTLGLAENAALDPYGNRVTYRVHPGLAVSFVGSYNAMDMTNCFNTLGTGAVSVLAPANVAPAASYSQCDAAAACTNCTVSCNGSCSDLNNVLLNNGLPVTDGSGNWLNQPSARSGAAYVLIAHGPNAAGAYTTSGALSAGSGFVGTSEALNRNGIVLMTGSVVPQSYRDAPYNDTQAAQHFDDVTLHPTILDVLTRAKLDPRKP